MTRAFFSVFVTVFLAEIGDKTQLATMLFASEAQNNKWLVFAASATALGMRSIHFSTPLPAAAPSTAAPAPAPPASPRLA